MKVCPKCGHMLNENDNICLGCGTQLSQMNMGMNMNQMPQQQQYPSFTFGANNNINYQDEEKTFVQKYGIIVLTLIILVAVGVILIIKNANENKKPETVTPIDLKDPDPQPDPEPEPDPEPDPEPEPDPKPDNKHTISAGPNEHLATNLNYTYVIPDVYIEKDYEKTGLNLLHKDNKNEIMFTMNNGSFEELKVNLEGIKQNYINNGASVQSVRIQQIAGEEMIITSLEKNNQRILIGYAEFDGSTFLVISVYNNSTNDYDFELMQEATKIAQTCVKDAVVVDGA